jgi:hypothetical protein
VQPVPAACVSSSFFLCLIHGDCLTDDRSLLMAVLSAFVFYRFRCMDVNQPPPAWMA